MTESPPPAAREEFLESLANGLQVLNIFSGGVHALTMQETAEKLGITRAAARRLLLTLTKLGYLQQLDRHFSLTPKVLDLGFTYFSSLNLPDLIRPVMKEVVEATGETCSLGVLDGPDVVFVAREESNKLLKLDLKIGSRLPAYAHSLGQCLLSQLDKTALEDYLATTTLRTLASQTVTSRGALKKHLNQVRHQGYSISVNELVDGFAGVSVPIAVPYGTAVAGLGVAMVLGNRTRQDLETKVLPVLLNAAALIQARIPGSVA